MFTLIVDCAFDPTALALRAWKHGKLTDHQFGLSGDHPRAAQGSPGQRQPVGLELVVSKLRE